MTFVNGSDLHILVWVYARVARACEEVLGLEAELP